MKLPKDFDLYVHATVRDTLADHAWCPLTRARRDIITRQIMQRVRDLLRAQGGGGGNPTEPL